MLQVTQFLKHTHKRKLLVTHSQSNMHLHVYLNRHRPTAQQHTHTPASRETERPTEQQHLHTPASSETETHRTTSTHTHASSKTETHRTTTSTHTHASSKTETHRTATGHLPESWPWFAWRWHGAEGQGQWGQTAWRTARPARSDPACPACCLDVESEHTHTPVHCQQCVDPTHPPTHPPVTYVRLFGMWYLNIHTHADSI